VFTREELSALAIAVIVLTLCFSVAFMGGILNLIGLKRGEMIEFFAILPVAFIAVLTAFALHELAHKITANYYGHYAAFSYSKQGLILAAILSFLFGVLFAAPGAVFIYGQPTRKENGIISLAGPLTNLSLGIVFSMLFFVFVVFSLVIKVSGFLASAFFLLASINIFIGAFNMIPIMPFDGSKIWKWNKAVYILMLFFFIPLLLFYFLIRMI
jgi:Zn-dependent protease